MHNPRGSNNRNCRNDNNDRRRNGNRLFDSQNNDKGGYSCPRSYPFKRDDNGQNGAVNAFGDLTSSSGREIDTDTFFYYEGTTIHVEWTSQHGSGENENIDARMLFQYACADDAPSNADSHLRSLISNEYIRDGTPINNNDGDNTNDEATTTIPENANSANCAGSNCPLDGRYGFHETHEWYEWCEQRERNKGLFTADQLPINSNNNNRAKNTRQNPNGNRRGLECPEERDYWPYWTPTMWKDIAIGVPSEDMSACEADARESQNVKDKCYCDMSDVTNPQTPYPNNQADCDQKSGDWKCAGKWNLDAPSCFQLPFMRDNHLGNQVNGYAISYNWTLPWLEEGVNSKRCVLRLRYNASTDDFDKNLDRTSNCDPNDYDCTNSPIADRDNREELTYVHVFGSTDDREKLSLAVNTNQYARTFQDRTYVFDIKRRTSEIKDMCKKDIVNVNVRGKRGNIVQTYPSVEYDFVPQDVQVEAQDCLHMQWIGSDYNPNRNPNNGEGGPYNPNNVNEAKADRTNLVQFERLGQNHPLHHEDVPLSLFSNKDGEPDYEFMRRMAFLDQDINDCDTLEQLKNRNPNNRQARERDPRNCAKLNAQETPYFKGGVFKVYAEGTHKFMSTRNNNFSNRSQKLKVVVTECKSNCEGGGLSGGAVAGIVIGVLAGVGLIGFAAVKYGPLKDKQFTMPQKAAMPNFQFARGSTAAPVQAKPAV